MRRPLWPAPMADPGRPIAFRTESGVSFAVTPRSQVLLEREGGLKVTMIDTPNVGPDHYMLCEPADVSIVALTQHSLGQRYEGRMLGRRFSAEPRRDTHTLLPAGSDSVFQGRAGAHRYAAANLPIQWLGELALEHAIGQGERDLAPRMSASDPLLDALSELIRRNHAEGTATPGFADHWVVLVALAVLRLPMEPGAAPSRQLPPARLRLVLEYVEAHLDEEIALVTLARLAGFSAYHFARRFRASMGVPPHRHVLQRRVALAQRLLRSGEMGLSEVAQACGFAAQSHLTSAFRRAVGMPPGRWRLLQRQQG